MDKVALDTITMIQQLNIAIGLAGTVAFAITAVLIVAAKGIDVFGATVMGLITAIGGGTLRDLILNEPVFWARNITYIWVAIGASLVTFWVLPFFTRREIYRGMLYVDALGVALFAIQAAHKVLALKFAWPLGPILLGIVTAVGGGLIRDVLAGNRTLLMSRDLYAVPVMLGCTAYVILMHYFPAGHLLINIGCILFIFVLRAASIFWGLRMPDWLSITPKQP